MKNYILSLEVLTPTYIGNGNIITKKDFALQDDKAFIYDSLKLHDFFGDGYEQFMFSDMNLSQYLDRYKDNKMFDLTKISKYSLPVGGSGVRRSDGIHEFIKDAFGKPYVPGSSIKGVLRTAILAYKIFQDKQKYNRFINIPIENRSSAKEIEEIAFGQINNNDFKYLRISDSLPLSTNDLMLAPKIDVFTDGNINSSNRINICRESLKPNTKLKFILTIEQNREGEDIFTPSGIINAIEFFTKQYREVYLKKFLSYKDNMGDNVIYLGGGTGFLTKTINHSLYGKDALKNIANYLKKQFKKGNHDKDIKLGVSPRALKCTKISGRTVEMGICKVEIIDATI